MRLGLRALWPGAPGPRRHEPKPLPHGSHCQNTVPAGRDVLSLDELNTLLPKLSLGAEGIELIGIEPLESNPRIRTPEGPGFLANFRGPPTLPRARVDPWVRILELMLQDSSPGLRNRRLQYGVRNLGLGFGSLDSHVRFRTRGSKRVSRRGLTDPIPFLRAPKTCQSKPKRTPKPRSEPWGSTPSPGYRAPIVLRRFGSR